MDTKIMADPELFDKAAGIALVIMIVMVVVVLGLTSGAIR